jgi:hypothetical protein
MGFLGRRLLAIAILLVIVAIGWVAFTIGNLVGMPFDQSMPLALTVVGVTALAIRRVYSYGAPTSPIVVASIVMLLFAAVGSLNPATETWTRVNPFLLFLGAVAIQVVAYLVLSGLLAVITRSIVRARRSKERRSLADSRGWQFKPSDANLPSALGATDHYVAHLPDNLFTLGQRHLRSGARAHAIVRGVSSGVEFVAFDFFVPNQHPLVVTTAWLVQLPHALPLFASAEMFRDDFKAQSDTLAGLVIAQAAQASPASQAGDDAAATLDPEYAHAVMTPDVVRFTREQFPSWWVDGTVLASTARSDRGAGPDLLARNIQAITWLASVLSMPEIARYAAARTAPHEPHPS